MLHPASDRNSLAPWQRWIGVAIASVVSVGGTSAFWHLQAASSAPAELPISQPTVRTVTALGRLEPQDEVIQLSAPTSSASNRVEQLLVREGDSVTAGQVIAILDSHDRLQAALSQVEEEVRVAQAQLAITLAGAREGEIAAQQAEIDRLVAQHQGDIDAQAATIARLESEVRNAETEYQRYAALYQEGAIAASDLDGRRLTLETSQRSLQEAQAILNRIQSTSPAELNQARANLQRIAEVRPVDVQARQAEVDRAIAAVEQAQAELDQSYVRSPVDGKILDILTQPGEVVSSDGIAEIGQTQHMYAVAEVYQSDIHRVQVGQRVRVSSDALPDDLWGVVERIDAQVRRQTVVNTDPSANIDARVIEVHVALDPDSSDRAAQLTRLQVTVEIQQ